MYAERTPEGAIVVWLSRRNLLSLLAKLDGYPENSNCEISKHLPPGKVFVVAEEDVEHYDAPERVAYMPTPGRMHPATEERIRTLGYGPEDAHVGGGP